MLCGGVYEKIKCMNFPFTLLLKLSLGTKKSTRTNEGINSIELEIYIPKSQVNKIRYRKQNFQKMH